MAGRFEGRVAIVTGGASGIGAATVERLLAEGAAVLSVDRTKADGARTGRLAYHRADLTDPAAAPAMIAVAIERFGRLDYLVNNAGTGGLADAADQTDAEWARIFAINTHAVMYGCRAALPVLRRQGGGAIVNIASISGIGGDYGMGAYAASKGAVVNYTRSVAMDCARDGIRVNALCPGLIDTPLSAGVPDRAKWTAGIPMGRSARASEMASAIAFLLSDDASFVTGSILVADGGLTAYTGQPRSPNLPPLPEIGGGQSE